MDKREATLRLTRFLADQGYRNEVSDESIKTYLLNNADSVVLDLDGRLSPVDVCYPKINNNPEANYLFYEKNHQNYNKFMPVAMIGDIEKRLLSKINYKADDDNIHLALNRFEMNSYIKQYRKYSKINRENEEGRDLLLKEVSGNRIHKGDILTNNDFYIIPIGANEFSYEGWVFEDILLNNPMDKKMTIKKSETKHLRLLDYDGQFIDFIFSIPKKHQNIEANKLILKLCDIDYKKIVLDEYQSPSYDNNFKEYFTALLPDQREEVLKSKEEQGYKNKELDEWILSVGENPRYLEIYKDDAERFISFYSNQNPEDRIKILSNILNLDYVNEEVKLYIDENDSELLPEAGFCD